MRERAVQNFKQDVTVSVVSLFTSLSTTAPSTEVIISEIMNIINPHLTDHVEVVSPMDGNDPRNEENITNPDHFCSNEMTEVIKSCTEENVNVVECIQKLSLCVANEIGKLGDQLITIKNRLDKPPRFQNGGKQPRSNHNQYNNRTRNNVNYSRYSKQRSYGGKQSRYSEQRKHSGNQSREYTIHNGGNFPNRYAENECIQPQRYNYERNVNRSNGYYNDDNYPRNRIHHNWTNDRFQNYGPYPRATDEEINHNIPYYAQSRPINYNNNCFLENDRNYQNIH